MKYKRILAIGAHPDDIEYGCFGFLASKMKNAEIYCFIATLGSKGDPSTGPVRALESKKALSLLKPKEIFFSKNNDFNSSNYENCANELFKYINTVKPDLILTHSPHDTHQEHRLVYDLTMTASRRTKASILRYGILSNTLKFSPTFFKDISNQYALKLKALSQHKSQKNKYYMSKEYLKIFHQNQYVTLNQIELSESYEVERLFE
jgi:LmbE family N-acetylglucosaminyl deacetylase